MDGNIEQAAWMLSVSLDRLAAAIESLNYFSQKAVFVAAPPAPPAEPLQPSYPQPTYPQPTYIPPNGGTTTPMPPRPIIWNSVNSTETVGCVTPETKILRG